MNKERYNQIIDEAYESYLSKAKNQTTEDLFGSMIKGDEIILGMLAAHTRDFIPYTREQFIDECKTNIKFSEMWGLKIEERKLNQSELNILYNKRRGVGEVDTKYTVGTIIGKDPLVPRKLITVTYNNETIEVYE